ncbi:MAG: YdiU family protein [Pseudomonadota bacterium]
MTLGFAFDNTYAELPERFFTRMGPSAVESPSLLLLNKGLASLLDLDAQALCTAEGLAVLAGNAVPDGAAPLAQVYAGHQFGGFSPQLGDGRALLLGEVVGRDGIRRDIQLKGSGPTPYSRMGDGRAWLGPVLREYIVSEAMHALGVPTTRALAAVATGQTVMRETPLPGAVLTRVATSHIRVGTFQFFAARQDVEALQALTDHVIARHYPEAATALEMFDMVLERQAALVAEWMGLGFIHGVMNTDNTSIAGETIDYGPCAFMEAFNPGQVYSSIDQYGRYAYGRQPEILSWNLAQLATSLLPVIDSDRDAAVAQAQPVMETFPERFQEAWLRVFRRKLGLVSIQADDVDLIEGFLRIMVESKADFTNTFRALGSNSARDQFLDPEAFDAWEVRWTRRLSGEPNGLRARIETANPAVIPRNHLVEAAIEAAVDGDLAPTEALVAATDRPFQVPPDPALIRPARADEAVQATFCGT